MNYLIKNVKIFDEESEKRVCILTKDGKIERISESEIEKYNDYFVIDGQGKYLFPGFIDFHTHLFKDGSEFGLEADRLLSAGIVCAVDMGTAGYLSYSAFHKCNIQTQKIEIKTLINVSPMGQLGKGINEVLDDELLNENKIKEMVEKYDEIFALKLRLSKSIVKDLGVRPLKKSLEISKNLNLPLCVHVTDPPISFGELATQMKKGDIITHIYQNKGKGLFKENGDIEEKMIDAQERGVIMDIGNGKNNFDFNIAEKAIKLGFLPNIISSDSTNNNFHKLELMWDLPFVMSKFMSLGLSLNQVVDMVTINPAKVLGIDNRVGKIKEGFESKLVLCDISEGKVEFSDSEGNRRTGNKQIKPIKVIYGDEIIEC